MLNKRWFKPSTAITIMMVIAVSCSASVGDQTPPTTTFAEARAVNGSPTAPNTTVVKPDYFETIAPGAPLPTGEQCQGLVRPAEEVVPENTPYNQTTGKTVAGKTYLSSNIDAADLEARIDGQFTGTTDEIIQWGACKWGFDENLVRAQAYVESTWFAGKLGDCGEQAREETGGEGGCGSVGIMQVRAANLDPVFPGVWPEAWKSTAFNLDYALAVKRACFEGREVWLQNQPDARGDYEAGDEWGCMGRWVSGTWYNDLANDYLESVQKRLDEQAWKVYVGCPDWETNFYCTDLDREIVAE